MNKASITKVLKKVDSKLDGILHNVECIGFIRWMSLPRRIVKDFNTAMILNGVSLDDEYNYKTNFFKKMSREEFINFLERN